jgi:hypothetical protein
LLKFLEQKKRRKKKKRKKKLKIMPILNLKKKAKIRK